MNLLELLSKQSFVLPYVLGWKHHSTDGNCTPESSFGAKLPMPITWDMREARNNSLFCLPQEIWGKYVIVLSYIK